MPRNKRLHEMTDAEFMQYMHEEAMAKDAEREHEIGG